MDGEPTARRRSRAELRELVMTAALDLLRTEGLGAVPMTLTYQRVFDHLEATMTATPRVSWLLCIILGLATAAWSAPRVLELPPIDREALLAEDLAAKDAPGPARFALAHDLLLEPQDGDGWQRLVDGGHRWQLDVRAPGALNLNFGFSRFQLPWGATLTITNDILNKATEYELTSGRGPLGVAAASTYIASVLSGERRTQKEIAEAAGVTEVTIRNRYKELIRELDIDLNLNQ